VLANRLTTMLTLPERLTGLLRLKALQRDLMFEGAELQPGACPR